MKRSRLFAWIFGAALLVPLVPAAVSAQSIFPYAGCGTFTWGFGAAPCTTGTLHVIVVVNNYDSYAVNLGPSDFAVTVRPQASTPMSFPGSVSGTDVAVAGSYTVAASEQPGYVPNYSLGCNGTVSNGQDATCYVTENALLPFLGMPYGYGSALPTLACAPVDQTVALGQTASFFASGSASGPFNWSTSEHTYTTSGPSFSTSFTTSGTRLLTVSSGMLSSTCTVNVTTTPVPVAPSNPYPQTIYPYYPTATSYPSSIGPDIPPGPAPSVTSSYLPSLPNTGFEPHSAMAYALAVVALIAAGLLVTPYVRKAIVQIG